ncbi:hypothetical protein Dimus_035361 [Dionaea muscipula]
MRLSKVRGNSGVVMALAIRNTEVEVVISSDRSGGASEEEKGGCGAARKVQVSSKEQIGEGAEREAIVESSALVSDRCRVVKKNVKGTAVKAKALRVGDPLPLEKDYSETEVELGHEEIDTIAINEVMDMFDGEESSIMIHGEALAPLEQQRHQPPRRPAMILGRGNKRPVLGRDVAKRVSMPRLGVGRKREKEDGERKKWRGGGLARTWGHLDGILYADME